MTSRPALRAFVALASVVVALTGPAAQARQLRATDEPKTSGPVSEAGSSCSGDRLEHEGETIARVESCIWVYRFDETMETDLTKTYGAVWVQNTVDPMNGWCATYIPTEITIPKGTYRHARAPRDAIKVARRKRVKTKLVVDAAGQALEPARISNGYTLFPRRLKTGSSDGGRTTRVTWSGKQSRTLAFAGGLEASWSFLGTPRFRAGFGLMKFVKSRGC